jgi:hypothetical protein
LLDISGRARDVEAAKWSPKGINEREQGRQSKRTHERYLLKALCERIQFHAISQSRCAFGTRRGIS